MYLFRAYIENKKVINRAYWGNPDDTEIVKLKKQITDKFSGETFPFEVNMIGVDMGDANVITIHQCSVDSNNASVAKIQNNLLLDKDFMRYIYDLDNTTKTIEVFYKDNNAYSMQPLGEGLSVYRISDMFDKDFNNLKKQSVYVQGPNDKVFAWANSLNSSIAMPISASKKLHADDSYQFQFNDKKELVSVRLFTHLIRTQVYGDNSDLYVEYTADFADEITNLDDTEIVLPKYDNHGNRIAQSVNKANIGEYVMVPKDDGSGGYDKVLLKDL